MAPYTLTTTLEFVGCESNTTGLQVWKASNKDEANPSRSSFIKTTIGPPNIEYLEVFNGTVTASKISRLRDDLRDQNLWVNRDGFCYIRIPGSNSPNNPRPTKFMRLNDLFNWEDYVDVPAGQTFTPTPSTTIWNRRDSITNQTKVDYEKLDADLKQTKDDKKKAEDDLKNAKDDLKKAKEDKKKAEDDKKQAEDDLKKAKEDKKKAEDDKKKAENDKKKAEDDKKKAENDKKKAENDKKKAEDDKKKAENDKKKAGDDKKKAENDKKKAEDDKKKAEDDKKKAENDKKKAEDDKKKTEDELQEVRKQKREMTDWMDRLKENWVKAIRVGAKPLPPSAFFTSSIPNPNASRVQPLQGTWLGEIQKRVSDPGSYVGSIGTGSIQVHNAVNGYVNDFETHFWWVVQVDAPNDRLYGFMIAFDGTGRYPSLTDQFNFQRFCVKNNYPIGPLDLPGLGVKNVIILRFPS